MSKQQFPPMYVPETEHDACGVGFIATLNKVPNNSVLKMGIEALGNLTHRGAVGGDLKTGDGAGILFQIPHDFFKSVNSDLSKYNLGEYGVGQIFFPNIPKAVKEIKKTVESPLQFAQYHYHL